MSKRVVTQITRTGQPFVDIPQYKLLKSVQPQGIAAVVQEVFGTVDVKLPLQKLSHYVRQRLRWIKPYTFADLTEEERQRLKDAPLTRGSEHDIVKAIIEARK